VRQHLVFALLLVLILSACGVAPTAPAISAPLPTKAPTLAAQTQSPILPATAAPTAIATELPMPLPPTLAPTEAPTVAPSATLRPTAIPTTVPTITALPTPPPPPTARPTRVPVPANAGPASGTRIGAICQDGTRSSATGRGACSHHGGVDHWLYAP